MREKPREMRDPSMDIQFDCPLCGQNLSVEERGAGMLVNCPNQRKEMDDV